MHKHFKCLLKKECINKKSRERYALLVNKKKEYSSRGLRFFFSFSPQPIRAIPVVREMFKYVNSREALNINSVCGWIKHLYWDIASITYERAQFMGCEIER